MRCVFVCAILCWHWLQRWSKVTSLFKTENLHVHCASIVCACLYVLCGGFLVAYIMVIVCDFFLTRFLSFFSLSKIIYSGLLMWTATVAYRSRNWLWASAPWQEVPKKHYARDSPIIDTWTWMCDARGLCLWRFLSCLSWTRLHAVPLLSGHLLYWVHNAQTRLICYAHVKVISRLSASTPWIEAFASYNKPG